MWRLLFLTSTLVVSWALATETPSSQDTPVHKKETQSPPPNTLSSRAANPNPTFEWNVPTRTQGLVYATPEPSGSQGFFANLEVGQVVGVEKNGSQNFTEFLVEGSYRFNRRNEIGFGDEAKELYAPITAGGRQFLLNDAPVYYGGLIADDFLSLQWKANVGATLPLSQYSMSSGRMTRTMAGLEISRTFWDKRISLRYQPAFSFYFNRYSTDSNGVPMRRMAIAQMVDGKWDWIPQLLSLNVWGQEFIYFFETYDNSLDSPAPSTELQFGSYLGIELANIVQLQVGYVRGNTLVPDFHYEDDLTASTTSRLYAALKVGF